jgi:hypothetical protein
MAEVHWFSRDPHVEQTPRPAAFFTKASPARSILAFFRGRVRFKEMKNFQPTGPLFTVETGRIVL